MKIIKFCLCRTKEVYESDATDLISIINYVSGFLGSFTMAQLIPAAFYGI